MTNLHLAELNNSASIKNTRIISEWFDFFKNFEAGCTFAAMAARKPGKFGWLAKVIKPLSAEIDSAIQIAINDPSVSTLSLIFPQVQTQSQLQQLLHEVKKIDAVWLEFTELFDEMICYGFRMNIGENHSWITGFGNFDFLPKTRRSPYTSITLRVKPKPYYEWIMKPSKENELHLADMNVYILSKRVFEKMWNASFERAKNLLGHNPDLKSAAKTTFCIPVFKHEMI